MFPEMNNHPLFFFLRRFALLASLVLLRYHAWTQSHSDSPYSDQAFDNPGPEPWYESPFFLAGIILALLGVWLFLRRANRRRGRNPREFMRAKDDQ